MPRYVGQVANLPGQIGNLPHDIISLRRDNVTMRVSSEPPCRIRTEKGISNASRPLVLSWRLPEFVASFLRIARAGSARQTAGRVHGQGSVRDSHPDQIIDFDLKAPVDAKKSCLIGPNGRESPYQLLEGGRSWRCARGCPPAAMR